MIEPNYIDLIERSNKLLEPIEGGHWVNGRVATGIPEIRLPDTHPLKGKGDYSRPILRVVLNGEDCQPPSDIHGIAEFIAKAPELVEELTDAVEDLSEKLKSARLPLNDEADVKKLVEQALHMFRDAQVGARADRCIDIVKRYMPVSETKIVEKPAAFKMTDSIALKIDEALYKLGYLTGEQSEEIAAIIGRVLAE